jgi:hypothetical protein
MSEIKDPVKEYDAQHGTPKGETPLEPDTASTAMPTNEKPFPFKSTSGGAS